MVQILKSITIKRVFTFIVALAVFCSAIFILRSLVGSQSLKHDEAVYLTKARSLLHGTPASEWRAYRPVGLVVLGNFLLNFTKSEYELRMLGVLLGAITLTLIFLLFKSMSNIWVGLGVAFFVGLSPLYLEQAPQYLSDLPAAGMLIGALWILWEYYKNPSSKCIYFFSVFMIGSFYIRYGVIIAALALTVTAILTVVPKFLSRENVNTTPLFVTLVLCLVLLIPHFVQSYKYNGSIAGIVLRAGGEPIKPKYFGEPLVEYYQLHRADKLGGKVVDTASLVGVIVTLIILFNKNLRRKYEGLLWLGSSGILTFIISGLLTHVESRFVFTSLVLLSGLGIMGVYTFIKSKIKFVADVFILALIATYLYFGKDYYNITKVYFEGRESSVNRTAYVKASEIIKADSRPTSCTVWSASFRPEISWYSGCYTLPIGNPRLFKKNFLLHFRKPQYSVVLTNVKNIQVTPENAAEYGVSLTEIYRSEKLSESFGQLVVYKVTDTSIRNSAETYTELDHPYDGIYPEDEVIMENE